MKKRIHIKKNTVFIDKIVSKYGAAQSAKMLGITVTAIRKYVKQGQAPQVTEMAAQLICEREEPAMAQRTALITGDPDFLETIHRMADLSNVEFRVIN